MAELQQELKYLTINTDASFHPKRKTSGYAYYIRCNLFLIKKGGNFKARKPKTSLEAEVMCIGNALSTVLSRQLPKIKTVVINTDCKGGIEHIKEKSGFIYERIRTLERLLKDRTEATIEYRHVKAHTGKENARSKVNEWCDSEAKKFMRNEKL